MRNQEVSQGDKFKFKVFEHVAEEVVRKVPGGVQVTEHPYCTDNVVIYYATTSNGKLCGAMSVIYNKPERYVHIDRLSVRQDPRTGQSSYKNVGSKLMQALYKDLQAGDEYDFIELDAYPSAIGFYLKLGFTLFDHSFININLDDTIYNESNLRWPMMYMDLRLATKLKVDFFRHLYHTILLASPKSLWLFLMEMQRVVGEDKLKLVLSNDTLLRNLIIMIASVKGSIKHPEEMLMVLAYFLKLSDLQARRLANGDGLISHLGQNVCGNKRSVDDMDNETDDDEMADDESPPPPPPPPQAVPSPVSSYDDYEPAPLFSSAGVAAASVFGAVAADESAKNKIANYQAQIQAELQAQAQARRAKALAESQDEAQEQARRHAELERQARAIDLYYATVMGESLPAEPRAQAEAQAEAQAQPPLAVQEPTEPSDYPPDEPPLPLIQPSTRVLPVPEAPYKQYNPYRKSKKASKLSEVQRMARRPTRDDKNVENIGSEDEEDEETEDEETEADQSFVPEEGEMMKEAERSEIERSIRRYRKEYVPPSMLEEDENVVEYTKLKGKPLTEQDYLGTSTDLQVAFMQSAYDRLKEQGLAPKEIKKKLEKRFSAYENLLPRIKTTPGEAPLFSPMPVIKPKRKIELVPL